MIRFIIEPSEDQSVFEIKVDDEVRPVDPEDDSFRREVITVGHVKRLYSPLGTYWAISTVAPNHSEEYRDSTYTNSRAAIAEVILRSLECGLIPYATIDIPLELRPTDPFTQQPQEVIR